MTHSSVMTALALAAMLVAVDAQAQNSDDFKDGYARGYQEGFDAGYQKALAEQRNAVDAASKNFPIAITAASYGPEGGNKRCDATHYARKEANGRRTASVAVTNNMCGDPAPGERKSLEITYLCGALAKTASAYEHRSAYLSCN